MPSPQFRRQMLMQGGGRAPDTLFQDGATYPLGGIAITPSGLYVASTGTSWFIWEAWNAATDRRVAKVCTLKHATRQWTPDVTIATLLNGDDSHGVGTLVRDFEGHVHAFFDGHGNTTVTTQHYATTAADNPAAWTARTALGLQNTYPHPHAIGSALQVFVRGTADQTLSLFTSSSLSGGVTAWNARVNIVTWGAGDIFYQGSSLAIGTEIYTFACKAVAGGSATERRDVFCFVYDTADGSVRNLADTVTVAAGSLPINLADSNTSFRIVDQTTGGKYSTIPSACGIAANDIHILYSEGATPTANPFTLKYTHWNGTVLSAAEDVGSIENRADAPNILRLADGTVEVYSTRAAVLSPTGRGGNLVRRRRHSSGAWGADEFIRYAVDRQLNQPTVVLNGHPDARLMVTEIAGDEVDPPVSNGGRLKGYVFGAGGFVRRTGLPGQTYLDPAFVPEHLFRSTDLTLPNSTGGWYFQCQDRTKLFETAGGAAADVAGDPIGLIQNRGWNVQNVAKYDGTQTTAANRPTLRNPSGNIWYAEFDGTNDAWLTTLLPSASFTMVAAFYASASDVIIGSNSATYSFMACHSTGVLQGAWGSQTSLLGSTVITNTVVIAMLRASLSAVSLYLNGSLTPEYTGAPVGAISTAALYLGARNAAGTPADFLTGRIYAAGAVQKEISDNEWTQTAAHFATLAGI